MVVLHRNLTGADLHEPKGVDTANQGEVYVADGAGSGSWLSPRRNIVQSAKVGDVSVANSVLLPCMTKGTLDKVSISVSGATSAVDFDVLVNGVYVLTVSIPATTAESFETSVANYLVSEDIPIRVVCNGTGTAGVTADVFLRIAESVT